MLLKNRMKQKNKVPYTREHIEFILKNYITNPLLCVKETGHSNSSIKMMLGNAIRRISGKDTFLGSELYAEVVREYLEANSKFGKHMSIEKFKLIFL